MGKIENAETGEKKHFHDAGELLSTLGKWNSDRFKALKAAKKS
jgi:hypothetical protein